MMRLRNYLDSVGEIKMYKEEEGYEQLLEGGLGFSLGASIISKLPTSVAKTGVEGGLARAGSFFPVMGTIGGASMALKQLKNIPRRDGSGRGTRENRGRGGCVPPRDRGIKQRGGL